MVRNYRLYTHKNTQDRLKMAYTALQRPYTGYNIYGKGKDFSWKGKEYQEI